MRSFSYLIENFFTHKDKLAPASELPGTMFTPLHFTVAGVLLALVILCAVLIHKKDKLIKPVFIALWATVTVLEVVKIVWESTTGNAVRLEVTGILPLYPCSIYMYAMPFAIWGKGKAKQAACGYVHTGVAGRSGKLFLPNDRTVPLFHHLVLRHAFHDLSCNHVVYLSDHASVGVSPLYAHKPNLGSVFAVHTNADSVDPCQHRQLHISGRLYVLPRHLGVFTRHFRRAAYGCHHPDHIRLIYHCAGLLLFALLYRPNGKASQ